MIAENIAGQVLKELAQRSNITRSSELEVRYQKMGLVLNQRTVETVLSLMTTETIRNQTEHQREIIDRKNFPNFNALLVQREAIRDLRLAPKRIDEVQTRYEQLSRDLFLALIKDHYINGSPMSLVNELYPTDLPEDLQQKVIWVQDGYDDQVVAQFITKIMQVEGQGVNDLILFERSRTTSADFVRVAIPEYRHIHLWMRGGNRASVE